MKAYLRINVNAIYPSEKFFLAIQYGYTMAILRRPVGHSRISMHTLGMYMH